MKPLPQTTFHEAMGWQAALLSIAEILVKAGIVADPDTVYKRELAKSVPPPPKTRKVTRNRKKGGHKTKCGNPGCTRGKGKAPRVYIRRRENQRFCHILCGQSYFATIRSYARALVRQNEDKVNEWIANNKWLTGAKADDDVARIAKLESNLWKRDQAKVVKKAKHEKGTTILKNTPTAASPQGH